MGFWAKCWMSGWMEWIPQRLLWLLKHLQYNCTAQFHKTVFLHNQQRLLTSCYSGWWSPSQSTTSSSVMTFDQLLFRLVVPIPVYKIILHNIIFSNDLWPVTIQVCGSYPSLQDHLAQNRLRQWLLGWWSLSQSTRSSCTTTSSAMTFDQVLFKLVVLISVGQPQPR